MVDQASSISSQEKVDPRHQRRVELMQTLFSLMFTGENVQLVEDQALMDEAEVIMDQCPEIDVELSKHAPERPLKDINQVDLAIMRLIVFEAKNKNTPKKVLIDEAIELAKEFGTDSSPKFVNGVLGKILLPINKEQELEQKESAQ